MKKKLTVTIGIPAYNEGNNVSRLLTDILKLSRSNYILDKIIVYSDGSTDNTVENVRNIPDSSIEIKENRIREGKIKALNYFFRTSKSDIFIHLDADILIKNKKLIDDMVLPFTSNKELGIVYGNLNPLEPRTYIERLAHFGFYVWEEAKKMVNADRYNCYGSITAYSRSFLNQYRLPDNDDYYTEDTYSFYFAKKNNFKTKFVKKALVYFKLPSSKNDYINQMTRYLSTKRGMELKFGKELVEEYETITPQVKYIALLKYGLLRPTDMFGYLFLHMFPKINNHLNKQKKLWDRIETSKIT